jgi:hypothetical protein
MGVRTLWRTRSFFGVVSAAALASGALAVLGVVAPATSGAATPEFGGVALPAITATGPTNSADFAGYGALPPSGSPEQSTSVLGAFSVPALDCATTPSTASWLHEEVGLFGGVGTKTPLVSTAALAMRCDAGKAQYVAAAEAGHKLGLAPFVPAAGDTIQVSAAESSEASSVSIIDLTQNKSLTEAGTGDLVQGAVWGMQSNKSNASIPTFTSVAFTGTLNGAELAAPVALPFNLMSGGKTLQIETSALSGTPTGWTETFEHN